MTKPIHDDLLRHFDGVLATTIDAIEVETWARYDTVNQRLLARNHRRARIGMGLHWMRRQGWTEIVMHQHADGPNPYWRLTRKGRAELRRRKRADP
jgi:hypothetical protein